MSFSGSNGLITQTGRDDDLSGLNGVSGVTVTTEPRNANGTNVIYYDLGTNRLAIQGTVFHDPEKEVLLFHNTAASAQLSISVGGENWKNITAWTRDGDGYLVIEFTAHGLLEGDCIEVRSTYTNNEDGDLKRQHRIRSVTTDTITLDNSTEWDIPSLNGQFHHRACYNYGREIINGEKTRTSKATGLYFTGWNSASNSNWNPSHAGISVGSGYFYSRGGTIHTARPMSATGGVDIKDTIVVGMRPLGTSANQGLEWRQFLGKGFVRNLGVVGMDIGNYTSLDVIEFTLIDSAVIETLGSYYQVNLNNLDTTTNVGDSDIGNDSYVQYSHRLYKLYNSVEGSSVRAMWRATRGSTGQLGAVEMYKSVKPTILDTAGTGVSDTKIYVKDTPSAAAKKGYVPNQSMDYVNGIIKSTNATPPVITILDHGLSDDQIIAVFGFKSTSNVNNGDPICGRKKVTVVNSDTIKLQNLDGTNVAGEQIFDCSGISGSINSFANNGGSVQLNISSDFTADLTPHSSKPGLSDRIYIRGIVGGSNMEALNGRLHAIKAVTSNSITLFTAWPNTNNTVSNAGTFNKVFKNTFNTTTTYDHLSPNTYLHTTDSNGEVAAYNILIGTQIHDWTTEEASATLTHGGPYDIDVINGSWRHKGTTDTAKYSDWDTDRFDGFYKVDRRGVGASTSDIFKFQFCNYNKVLSDYSPSLVGANTLTFDWVLFDDKTISEPDITKVLDYGLIDTPQKFYDRAKAHLYNNYDGETELIVTRDGNTIIADGYNVIITDNSSAAAFSISGDTITIKATTFIGNILTDSGHTTSLDGSPEVIGTFGDIVNLPWEVTNVESGSTVQLYNVTKDVELHNGVTDNGTQGEFTGQVSGMTTNVTITANTKGNSAVTLTGDGSTTINGLIDAWNTANPINIIALTSGNGSQTPADETTITIPAGAKATAIGSYTDTPENLGDPYAEVGDTIRLRITCQAGVFAFFPYETFGITTTSGITFKADQRLDFFYNDNGIDGSALEYSAGGTGTLTADYTIDINNDDGAIDIDEDGDDGKIDVRGIYAFYVYQTTTPTGIANWFGAITPIDHQNYRVNNGYDIKLENTGNNTVLVTGARLFREDGQSVLSSASNAPMMQDNGELVQYIRTQVNESIEQNIPPAVSDAVNANETITTIKKKTNLIPGLL